MIGRYSLDLMTRRLHPFYVDTHCTVLYPVFHVFLLLLLCVVPHPPISCVPTMLLLFPSSMGCRLHLFYLLVISSVLIPMLLDISPFQPLIGTSHLGPLLPFLPVTATCFKRIAVLQQSLRVRDSFLLSVFFCLLYTGNVSVHLLYSPFAMQIP